MVILHEATAKEIYDKYYTKVFDPQVFLALLKLDPTSQNTEGGDLNAILKGAYTDWLIRQYKRMNDTEKKRMLSEDAEQIKQALIVHSKLTKNKEGVDQLRKAISQLNLPEFDEATNIKDINSFDLHELTALAAAITKSTSEGEIGVKAEKDVVLIYQDDYYLVVSPKTHAAARKFGTGTNWCTATSNPEWFNDYVKQGPLVTITYLPNRSEKYQYHKQTGQFKDTFNKSVSVYRFLTSQIRKGPEQEESVDKVALAIEEFLKDKKWDYENVLVTDDYIKDVTTALKKQETPLAKVKGARLLDYCISKGIDVEIPRILIEDYKVPIKISTVAAALSAENSSYLDVILNQDIDILSVAVELLDNSNHRRNLYRAVIHNLGLREVLRSAILGEKNIGIIEELVSADMHSFFSGDFIWECGHGEDRASLFMVVSFFIKALEEKAEQQEGEARVQEARKLPIQSLEDIKAVLPEYSKTIRGMIKRIATKFYTLLSQKYMGLYPKVSNFLVNYTEAATKEAEVDEGLTFENFFEYPGTLSQKRDALDRKYDLKYSIILVVKKGKVLKDPYAYDRSSDSFVRGPNALFFSTIKVPAPKDHIHEDTADAIDISDEQGIIKGFEKMNSLSVKEISTLFHSSDFDSFKLFAFFKNEELEISLFEKFLPILNIDRYVISLLLRSSRARKIFLSFKAVDKVATIEDAKKACHTIEVLKGIKLNKIDSTSEENWCLIIAAQEFLDINVKIVFKVYNEVGEVSGQDSTKPFSAIFPNLKIVKPKKKESTSLSISKLLNF